MPSSFTSIEEARRPTVQHQTAVELLRFMGTIKTAKSFLKILEKSGIIDEASLRSALKELSSRFKGQMVRLEDLTKHLMDRQLITDWHCDKLLAGRYKGFFLGKYKLLNHLGSGGMSSVYLAMHRISGQLRAIKVLPRDKVEDKSYLDRFYREGKAAASLNHPNIVRMYDICAEDDRHFMVMEFVEGKDLYQMVKEGGPIHPTDAAKQIIQAASGLQHAHDRSLVHRDIKPANLLQSNDGTVKILDLGLALFQENEDTSLTVMYGERVMGTADYLSPEQAVDSHEIDHRADIYSLGCTLYYLLTGQPPFPTGSLAQRVTKHRTEYPTPIPEVRLDVPDALVKICEKMYRKKPENRFQSCEQLVAKLEEFLETGEVTIDETHGVFDALENEEADAAATKISAFAIDTTGSGKSARSSKKLPIESGRQASSTEVGPKKLMPVWAMIVILVMSFAAVTLSFLIARKLIGKNPRIGQAPRLVLAYNSFVEVGVGILDQDQGKSW